MKILIFSPGNAIWEWGFPAGLVAEDLKKRGHEVLFLYCDREFAKTCMTQVARGVPWSASPQAKEAICKQCLAHTKIITEQMELPSAAINSFITDEDRKEARRLANSATPETFRSIQANGVSVGSLSMYEFIIQNKKRSISFNGSELEYYRDILEIACKATFGFSRACDEFKPDICLIEHTAYSYNRACQLVAEEKKIPAYYMNGSSANVAHTFEWLVIAKEDPIINALDVIERWSTSKEVPVSTNEARLVTNHFIALTKAKGRVFSTARNNEEWNVRDKFGIKSNQKILLATTSSYDEMFAIEAVGTFTWDVKARIFETQIEWISALIEFARTRPDLFLIIRVHPREFMGNRDGTVSEHAQLLQEELKNVPENVAVNWPSDRISLYDLMEETDVALNAWSTAGTELGFFGIPVVLYSGNLVLYPETLNYSAKNREEYFHLIEKALSEGWDFERIRTSYRWYATQQIRAAVDISDSFQRNVFQKPSYFRRAYSRFRKIFNPFYNEFFQLKSRSKSLGSGDQIERIFDLKAKTFLHLSIRSPEIQDLNMPLDEETRAIRKELSRLYREMYGEDDIHARPGTLKSRLRSVIE